MGCGAGEMIVTHLIDPAVAGWAAVGAMRVVMDGVDGLRHRVVCVGAGGRAGLADQGVEVACVASGPTVRSQSQSVVRGIGVPGGGGVSVVWDDRAALVHGAWSAGGACVDMRGGGYALPTPRLDRTALRGGWGATQGTLVIAGIGQPSSAVSARRLAYNAGIVALTGRPALAVVGPEAREIARARLFIERHDHRWGLVVDSRPMVDLLSGIDCAMVTKDDRSPYGGDVDGARALGAQEFVSAMGIPVIADAVYGDLVEGDGGAPAMIAGEGGILETTRTLMRAIRDGVFANHGGRVDPVAMRDAFVARVGGRIEAALGAQSVGAGAG